MDSIEIPSLFHADHPHEARSALTPAQMRIEKRIEALSLLLLTVAFLGASQFIIARLSLWIFFPVFEIVRLVLVGYCPVRTAILTRSLAFWFVAVDIFLIAAALVLWQTFPAIGRGQASWFLSFGGFLVVVFIQNHTKQAIVDFRPVAE